MISSRLRKSSRNRVLFGVAGGLAEFFSVDAMLVRVAFILLILAGGSGLLLYLVLAVIIPMEETQAATPRDTIRENVQQMPGEVAEAGHQVREVLHSTGFGHEQTQESSGVSGRDHRRNAFATILIAVGVLVLMSNVGLLWWFDWGTFWPLVFIAIGIAILALRFRGG